MENIIKQLRLLEKERNIKILYACETGSRAWGFPSPDSDYDIRFIYMHNVEWYLSLSEKKDTIDIAIEDDLDICGWDLRKCLKLLKNSNVALIERFQSPIVYFEEENFRINFNELVKNYYSPMAVFYHHFSLAKNFWESVKDNEEIKLKSYFYMMRSLLSCNWIVNDNTVLPMEIEALMKLYSEDYNEVLRKLIGLKSTVGEKYLHKKEAVLQKMAEELFNYLEEKRNSIVVNKTNYNLLDKYFLKILYANTNN